MGSRKFKMALEIKNAIFSALLLLCCCCCCAYDGYEYQRRRSPISPLRTDLDTQREPLSLLPLSVMRTQAEYLISSNQRRKSKVDSRRSKYSPIKRMLRRVRGSLQQTERTDISVSLALSGQPDEAVDAFCKCLDETRKGVERVVWKCFVGRKWTAYEDAVWYNRCTATFI
jgi:hypothetical protein